MYDAKSLAEWVCDVFGVCSNTHYWVNRQRKCVRSLTGAEWENNGGVHVMVVVYGSQSMWDTDANMASSFTTYLL